MELNLDLRAKVWCFRKVWTQFAVRKCLRCLQVLSPGSPCRRAKTRHQERDKMNINGLYKYQLWFVIYWKNYLAIDRSRNAARHFFLRSQEMSISVTPWDHNQVSNKNSNGFEATGLNSCRQCWRVKPTLIQHAAYWDFNLARKKLSHQLILYS